MSESSERIGNPSGGKGSAPQTWPRGQIASFGYDSMELAMAQTRGQFVEHPAVIRGCQAELSTRPRTLVEEGFTIIAYERTRLHFDRTAWDTLPANGALLIRIRPTDGAATRHVCFSRAELELEFGSVVATDSWIKVRHYSYPTLPRNAEHFLVQTGDPVGIAAQVSTPSRMKRRIECPEDLTSAKFAEFWWARRGPLVADSPAYQRGVQEWRHAWRPSRVRVLLIAESHVAEALGDDQVSVHVPPQVYPAALPTGFVRLVYCPGYGNNAICSAAPSYGNPGTPQFWNIFERLAAIFDVELPTDLTARQVAVLSVLRERGIWLVDASMIALYHPSGIRLFSPTMCLRILRNSFMRYIWPEVRDDDPKQIWIIGQSVAKALGDWERFNQERVISQPGARRVGDHRAGLDRMVAAIASYFDGECGRDRTA